MPRPRKVICNKAVLFVTTSLEEGLLMPANPLINLILGSCLARAQELHPVKVCHYLFEPNHSHMLLAVDNPNDVPGFMERFKTESAHAINKLLGRQKRTIWCEGYDSPNVLTISSVISKIVYIYTNPAKDGLENTIDKYPGLTSWDAYRGLKKKESTYPRIRRPMIQDLSAKEYVDAEKLARKIDRKIVTKQSFTVYPDAWMDCFQIFEDNERVALNDEIKEKIYDAEKVYKSERHEKGMGVVGRDRLMKESMKLEYISIKKGRRTSCVSDDSDVRRGYMNDIRVRVEEAREVMLRWLVGDFSFPFPLGLFPPSLPKVCEPFCVHGMALGADY